MIASFQSIALTAALLSSTVLVTSVGAQQQRQLEKLGRGVFSVATRNIGELYVGWRLTREDPPHVAFNLYKRVDNGAAVKLNASPMRNSTNYLDRTADVTKSHTYFVRPVVDGVEGAPSASWTHAAFNIRPYLSIPIKSDLPYGGFHVGVGDLDGDGEYDYVVKRGQQEIDPSQNGTSLNTHKLEGYRRDGTFLWRVDLGWNIRQGIWYAPFLVYDLDGDGVAEVIAKIGEVDVDLDRDGKTNYVDSRGRILSGPEYFVIIDGKTGQIKARENWITRGRVSDWGDSYGNRVNRNLMCIAYLDGVRPSLVIFRGTYRKMVAEAWNYRNGTTTKLWQWNRSNGGGFHNLRTGDIDGDGKDEIVNGSIAIDDDGSQMWVTGEGHGDRMHMTDLDPDRPGLEVWYVQESGYQHPVHVRDARTGSLVWGRTDTGWGDVGRGTAADIDPRFRGVELWSSRGDLYSCTGLRIGRKPSSVNLAIWWDGDLQRELLDGHQVYEWDYARGTQSSIFAATGTIGPRVVPGGYADVLGDWREEIFYVSGNNELRIFPSTTLTDYRFPTLMQDADYRISVACEMMGYMQATQPSFYFGREPGRYYGAGCPAATPMGLSYDGVADTGQQLHLDMWNGVAQGAGLAILGFQNSAPYPIDLSGAGLTGCKLYQSVDAVVPVAFAANGHARLSMPVPNNVFLRGTTIYHQALSIDASAPGGLRLSEGARITIGK